MRISAKERRSQDGFTVKEAVICVGLMFIVGAGRVAALAGIGKASAGDPGRAAARAALARACAIAQALSKYTGEWL